MLILKLLFLLLVGVLLSGLWFVLVMLVSSLATKNGSKLLSHLGTVIAAAIPTIVILCAANNAYLNFSSVTDYASWLIIIAAVTLTSLVISRKSVPILLHGRELLLYCIDGALMEIPQRLMMQAFLLLLSDALDVSKYWSVIITAIVWCVSICLQSVITKSYFTMSTVLDLVSSFIFSLLVGFVFVRTYFIGFTMLAHFCERFLSTALRKRFTLREKSSLSGKL